MHESYSGLLAIVDTVLLVLTMSNMTSNMTRRALVAALWASMVVLAAACGSNAEQPQLIAVAPTAVPTTAALSVPTATLVATPTPTPTALTEVASTPLAAAPATATAVPTALPAPTLDPDPSPTADTDAAPDPTATPPAAEVVETPTPLPTATAEEPESTATREPETPTAVVASGEPPLECFDRDVRVYRAHVDGVDSLSFEGGRVYCSGAGTNAVSAANSYRHSTGLIIQRNGDFIFNDAGTAYIPYSGSIHFCANAQPASVPFRADTVPALLVVIDAEAQRQVSLGASSPASFTSSGAQC